MSHSLVSMATAAALAVSTLATAMPASADPLVTPRSGWGYPTGAGSWAGTPPPYGSGFGYGVVIGRDPGCVGAPCRDFTNRPFTRRYYHHYFDVPNPAYGQRRPEQRPNFRLATPHVEWCADRYRSYRAADNSWKPSGRARRQCVSPFM